MGQKVYGNNRIFCNGKFIAGPDVKSCVASTLMILLPSILWQIEVGTFFAERYSIIFPIVGLLTQVGSLVLLFATAMSDPGIMPRQKHFQEYYDSKSKSFRSRQPPRYFETIVRGHPFKVKYCATCNFYRPPRCTHCSVCENCIERFDHHCPWIGNCIGKRNYWLFYSFIMMTGALNVFVLATSIAQVAVVCQEIADEEMVGSGDALLSTVGKVPLAAALIVYDAAVVWFTVGLCVYHNYLICTNQTTYEQIRGFYGSGNPFNKGILANCQDVLCSRVRRRYFNPSTNRILWPSVTAASGGQDARDVKLHEPTSVSISDAVPADNQQVPPMLQEKRYDPETAKTLTYTELCEAYAGRYSRDETRTYWETTMTATH